MLSWDSSALENITPGVDPLGDDENTIAAWRGKIASRGQGFADILDDESVLTAVEDYAKSNRGRWKDIVVLGIGGSALGTICLHQALSPSFGETEPRLYVIDNVDPTLFGDLDQVLRWEKTLFVVVSKSGDTPETLAAYLYYRRCIEQKNLAPKEHFVFITDPERGFLRRVAQAEKIAAFDIPANVGGRFSVLTAVGLLPAALLGRDIAALLAGAKSARRQYLSSLAGENYSYRLAKIQFELYRRGKFITVMMPYAQKLFRLADWYRQLLAESLGKAKNRDGEIVNVGITPINALGVTDQHSQSQLYNEGPDDKFFLFLTVADCGINLPIPAPPAHETELRFLAHTDFSTLLMTEFQASRDALTRNQRPSVTLTLAKTDEFALGEIFFLLEGSIAFLGEFFNVDAFDQPGVELAKILTKGYLMEKL